MSVKIKKVVENLEILIFLILSCLVGQSSISIMISFFGHISLHFREIYKFIYHTIPKMLFRLVMFGAILVVSGGKHQVLEESIFEDLPQISYSQTVTYFLKQNTHNCLLP